MIYLRKHDFIISKICLGILLASCNIQKNHVVDPENQNAKHDPDSIYSSYRYTLHGGIVDIDSLFFYTDSVKWWRENKVSGYFTEYKTVNVHPEIWEFKRAINIEPDTIINIYNYQVSSDSLYMRGGSKFVGNSKELIGEWTLPMVREYLGEILRDTTIIEFTDTSYNIKEYTCCYDYSLLVSSKIKIIRDTIYSILPSGELDPYMSYKLLNGSLYLWGIQYPDAFKKVEAK